MNSPSAPRPLAFFAVLLLAPGSLAPAVLAQTPAAEVKNAANVSLMRLNTDAGFLLRGTLNVGAIPAAGAGARLMWHPAKAAFRAGFVNAAQWDDAGVGAYSTATGYGTTASGIASTATGFNTTASKNAATAMGDYTTASGDYATALGQSTTASGYGSTATGQSTTASGIWATAMGQFSAASGLLSTAVGGGTVASGSYSTAMGRETMASGDYASSMGVGTTAQAFGSLVIGQYNVASGTATMWDPEDPLLVGGDGTGDAARSNSFVIFKNGRAQFQGTVSASFASPSDARLKEDVAPLGPALARVLRLRPVTYRYRAETGRSRAVQVGLIAQEVQAVLPELVETAPDGYLGVAYANLAPVVVAAIQEQQAVIERQATEIVALRDRLGALERRLDAAAPAPAAPVGRPR